MLRSTLRDDPPGSSEPPTSADPGDLPPASSDPRSKADLLIQIRKAVGLLYREGNKDHFPVEPASPREIHALLTSVRAHLLTVIGIGGWALILYLMIFKPF